MSLSSRVVPALLAAVIGLTTACGNAPPAATTTATPASSSPDAAVNHSGSAPDSSLPSVDSATLPRTDVTLAQRAAWRPRLQWPDDCESAFQATHVGEDGGLLFVSPASGGSFVRVTCAAGAYQPSSVWLRLSTSREGATSGTLMPFPVPDTDTGRVAPQDEIWGEWAVDDASAHLTLLSVSRQTADCGVWARYTLAADGPQLLAAATRHPCPPRPGEAARLDAHTPPAGWTLTNKE